MYYKIKELLDNGLDTSKLNPDHIESINLIKTLSNNFENEDDTALQLDKAISKDIIDNYPDAIRPIFTEPASDEDWLIGDKYFTDNPDKIMGEQTEGTGQFGNKTIVVKGKKDVDIDVPTVERTLIKSEPEQVESTKTIEQNIENAFKKEDKFVKERKKQGRKIKVTTDNEHKPLPTDIDDFRTIVKKYNPNVSNEELEAYCYCNPIMKAEKYFDKYTLTEKEMIEKGLIYWHGGTFEYKWTYLAGNIRKKEQELLNEDKDFIINNYGQQVFDNQLNDLHTYKPKERSFGVNIDPDDRIILLPHSQLARSFKVKELNNCQLGINYEISLFDAFKTYLRWLPRADFDTVTMQDIFTYYIDNRVVPGDVARSKHPTQEDKIEEEKAKAQIMFKKSAAKKKGDELFDKFINDELSEGAEGDKARLSHIWNLHYNGFTLPVYSKIPVGFVMANNWYKNKPVTMSATQRDSVAFINYAKSGILALEVGLGKTLASIAAISQAIENGYAKYPLIVVPKSVYHKWTIELQGGLLKDSSTFMKGVLPHLPKLRGLENLNVDVIEKIKTFSKEDNKEFDQLENEIEKTKNILNEIKKGNQIYPEPELFTEASKYFDIANTARSSIVDPSKFFPKYLSLLIKYRSYLVYSLGKITPVEPGTITIITKEGLENVGLNNYEEIVEHLFKIIEQGDTYKDATKRADTKQKLLKVVASLLGNPKVFIEDLQSDMLIYDEAHACKKIFTTLKGEIKGGGDEEGEGTAEQNYILDYVDEGQAGVKETKTTNKGKAIIDVTDIAEGREGRGGTRNHEKSYYELDYGQAVPTALRGYVFSTYIQQHNKNRNVILLTGTPFENHPLEIYSMLSLANHRELVKMGYGKIKDFFDTFLRLDYGLQITIRGDVTMAMQMNGYTNLVQFRNIIRNIIFHKTGEEANIIRPNKITLPTTDNTVKTEIGMNPTQQEYTKLIEGYLHNNIREQEICEIVLSEDILEQEAAEMDELEQMAGDDIEVEKSNMKAEKKQKIVIPENIKEASSPGVSALKGISWMRNICISPYLFRCRRIAGVEPTAKEYIETSPKLKYVCDCINTVKKWHEHDGSPCSGEVIYMNNGVGYFHLIKEYLTDPKYGIGFSKDEVQIIASSGTRGQAKSTEAVKEGFNSGKVKVIIGSSSISVGVDLQRNASVLYNMWLDWNPSMVAQITGRVWRQGNRFENIRVVFPLIEDSADVIIFQYLQSKTSRLKDIWDTSSTKSQFDLEDFNPEQQKLKLIKDPVKVIDIEDSGTILEYNGRITYYENLMNDLQRIKQLRSKFYAHYGDAQYYLEKYFNLKKSYEDNIINRERREKLAPLENELETLVRPLDVKIDEKENELSKIDDKIEIIVTELNNLDAEYKPLKSQLSEQYGDSDDETEAKKIKKQLDDLKTKYTVTLPADLNNDKAKLEKEKAGITEKYNKEIEKIEKKIEERQKKLSDDIVKINERYTKRLKDVLDDYTEKIARIKPEEAEYVIDKKQYHKYCHDLAKNGIDFIAEEKPGFHDDIFQDVNWYSDSITSITRTLIAYRGDYKEYYSMLKHFDIDAKGEANIDNLPQYYSDKIKEINLLKQELIDSKPQRVEAKRMEMAAIPNEHKKPSERAAEFAKLNDYLLSKVKEPLVEEEIEYEEDAEQEMMNISKELKDLKKSLKNKELTPEEIESIQLRIAAMDICMELVKIEVPDGILEEVEMAEGGNIIEWKGKTIKDFNHVKIMKFGKMEWFIDAYENPNTNDISLMVYEKYGNSQFPIYYGEDSNQKLGWDNPEIVPERVKDTVLSIYRANKNEIHKKGGTLHDEVQKTLDFFLKTDLNIYGYVTDQTKEAFKVQGFELPKEITKLEKGGKLDEAQVNELISKWHQKYLNNLTDKILKTLE